MKRIGCHCSERLFFTFVCIAWRCFALLCIALHCITVLRFALLCVTLPCIGARYSALPTIDAYCFTRLRLGLLYIGLFCVALRYFALLLHIVTLHCIASTNVTYNGLLLHCIYLPRIYKGTAELNASD